MLKSLIYFCFLIFLFGLFVQPVSALGVGALGTRVVEEGVPVLSVSGFSAPESRVVVEDSANRVWAMAIVEKTGEFEFEFEVDPALDTSDLVIFTENKLGVSSKVGLSTYLVEKNRILLPSTVVSESVVSSDRVLELRGLVYPRSKIDVHLYSSSGFDRVYKAVADLVGEWRVQTLELPEGRYRASVVAQGAGLVSQPSQELFFAIGENGVSSSLGGGGVAELSSGAGKFENKGVWGSIWFVLFGVVVVGAVFLWWWMRWRKTSLVLDVVSGKGVEEIGLKLIDVASGVVRAEGVSNSRGKLELFVGEGGEYKLDIQARDWTTEITSVKSKFGYRVFDGRVIDIERGGYVKLLVWMRRVSMRS